MSTPRSTPELRSPPTAEAVIAAVAETFAVTPQTLAAPGRLPEMVDARKVAIRLLVRLGLRPGAIGRLVGRDRTTVWHHQHTRLNAAQRAVLGDLARDLRLPRPSGAGSGPHPGRAAARRQGPGTPARAAS